MGHQLTKQDIERMEAEIEHRKLVERPKLIEAVKDARAQGDLSENFEYYAAKREKNRNESRIRYLDRMIRTADIIEDSSAENEAGIGDIVEIYFEDERETEEVCLVTTMSADSLNQMVSIESPIGKAIRGKKEGDRVRVEVDKDTFFYLQIKKIQKSNK